MTTNRVVSGVCWVLAALVMLTVLVPLAVVAALLTGAAVFLAGLAIA